MTEMIRFHQTGGPEVLQLEQVELGEPGPGQVRIRQQAIGLNFIDIYHRAGLYPLPLPSGLGSEAAGLIEVVGEGVSEFQVGDRVGYCSGPQGAYAQARIMPADKLIKLPEAISFETAAAMLLQGLTAEYLLRRTYAVQAGDAVLIHAAAGGVGQIAVQWAKALGATVIATAGGAAKCARVRALGADVVIDYRSEDFVAATRAATAGRGVRVVYDGVGKDTFAGSLDCLAPRGLMVSYGNASGPVPDIAPLLLAQKGSLFLTRPTLGHYIASRAELLAAAEALFAVVISGAVQIEIAQRYPLQQAAQAHRDLAERRTTGSTILLP
ncbi:quinone oxidoreductase family protein [Chitinimonas taiwanensis]|uniref:NADPH2:quinone reductase n=1 Tax=Chitinimonas taiwanensis DSM 18899 TaxID=1121279 RepID=A0A1K2H9R9_9NEIS|nr:quinone oxidoreductase [Chitinimonas taiwanensis]SFZ73543.1 NADPH2:quinone reductase [Chitinimonas taiwanensis DSM 18899]